LKNNSISSLILKVYTEVPQLSVNSSLVPDSEFYLKNSPCIFTIYPLEL
jgi:hypothetical protein